MKNYFRLILAIFLIPTASNAVSADRPYPTFTASDLVQCRAEISKFQQAVAKWWGKKDQKIASALLRKDPVSWFAAGPGNGCAEAWDCWGGSTDDSSSNFKNPDENLDAINAMAKGESKMSPDEMAPYQVAADKCVAKAWLAKWQGSNGNLGSEQTSLEGKRKAKRAKRQELFGSLAIDKAKGTAYGWAVGYRTQTEADEAAQGQCASKSGSCTRVMWFKNSCASYAIDAAKASTAYGWAYAKTKGEADSRALQECQTKGGSTAQCLIRVWGCTSD
ncbi:MAG: DUF4189 domain-containing protein [Rhodocyclaceae bacterium]|nr:DUF4189 domain-containing protein [Rhodocyclaceae bacterium]